MKKDDVLELTIEDMGIHGEGIGKVQGSSDSATGKSGSRHPSGAGITLFVKEAITGDRVRAKVMKMKKNYGYGRLMEVLAPSPDRVQAPCPVFQPCGGCQLQVLSYKKQLEFKENKVRNNLKRIGGFADIPMEKPLGMEQAAEKSVEESLFYYRNKAQYPIGTDKNGKIIAGFYASGSHRIVPNHNQCMLGPKVSEEILNRLIRFMETHKVPAYDETAHKGLVRHVLIRQGEHTGEIMVCLVINGKKLPHSELLVESLREIKGMTSISLNVNTENTNVILGRKILPLWGSPHIHDTIAAKQSSPQRTNQDSLSFKISPLSFYQVNSRQMESLYRTVLDYADLRGRETVWDLYCGIGTISLFLAQKAKQVFGIEVVEDAIEDAKENAAKNSIFNASFFLGKVEEVLPKLKDEMGSPDVVVLDPPRKGCDKTALDTILEMGPKGIIYVSCDSSTLARDLAYLCEKKYKLDRVKVCDMFGMTVREECIARIVRNY